MSSALRFRLSSAEYLATERKAAFKSEYFNGEMFAMAGASEEHCLVKENLARETGVQLKGGRCRLVTSDLRVKVEGTKLYTYPDLVIYCDKPQFEDAVLYTLLNPRVIVEVLSDSTESYDRGAKFHNYRQIASLQEYVLVSQDRPLIERFVRQADGTWSLTVFTGLDATMEFASVPAKVPLAEVYRDVTFPNV